MMVRKRPRGRSVTASIKAVGGLDRMTCPTQVNCRKHRQSLTSQRCCEAPTKMVRSQVAGFQCTAHGQCDCRCSRQGLNHPPLLERNMVNPTFRHVGGQTLLQGTSLEWRAEERWRKLKLFGNRTDRSCSLNSTAQAGPLPAWSFVTRKPVEPSPRGKANERGFIHVCVLWPGDALGADRLAQV